MKFYCTGDCHGDFSRFKEMNEYNTDTEVAIIILGDAGLDFYLNKTDENKKRTIMKLYPNFIFYLVRGNHEERPTNLKDIELVHDNLIDGDVYYFEEFPNIRYLRDGNIYTINGHKTLVLGGAYSIDKWRRLGDRPETTTHWTGWFKDEQLTPLEMTGIMNTYTGQHIDIILSHTCPYNWRPTDLFLSFIDQSTVDSRMEVWMEQFKHAITWNLWLYGHYHDNRAVRPHVEMLYQYIEPLEDIWNRWNPNIDIETVRWLKKDPNFYMED